ncbi:MAG: hypothetical protein ACI4QT_09100 [Kiritimatiellia bacterium]
MKIPLRSAFSYITLIALSAIMGEMAHAEILLNDGFPAGTGGYCTGSTKTSLKGLTAISTTIVGFAEDSYTRGTGTIFAMPSGSGLALPQKLIDAGLDATGDGSAAIGLQSSAQTAGTDKYRHQSRKISASLARKTGETLYFRGLFKVDSASFSTLVAADGLTVSNNYGMGFWNPTDTMLDASTAYMTYVTEADRFFFFNFAKTASGTAQVRLSIKTGDGTVSTVALADNATLGATYLCIAKIVYNTDGTQTVSAQAQTIDGFDSNTPYTLVGESIDLFDDSTFSLLFGGNYGTKGSVTFDEFRLATTETEVTVPSQPATIQFSSIEADEKNTLLNANVQLNTIASATVELKYGASEEELETTIDCGSVSENGAIQISLGELFPQTWYGQLTIGWDGGSYSTPVFSFVSPGLPEFSDVAAGGTLFTETGIWAKATLNNQGFADTGVIVTLYCGESEDDLIATNVWLDVSSGSELSYTLADAPAPGSTVYCQFAASYEYQGQTVEARSTIVSVKCEGTETWTGTNGSDWHDAGNWSGLAVPNESIAIKFFDGTGQVTATTDAFAKSINVTNASSLVIDMGGNTLTSGSFTLSRSSSSATLKNGTFNLGTQKWPETGLENLKLTIADDAIVESAGTLAYCGANDHINTYGKFSHAGALTIGPRWSNSTVGSAFSVLDGGEATIGSTLSVGWHNCKIVVANGSTLQVNGAIALGAGLSDQGSWATAWVSNATLKVTGNVGVGTDDRTGYSTLRIFHDEGCPATLVEIGGDLYTSNSGGTMRNCKGNNIVIRGGTLSVKGNIRVDGTTINAARTNMLYIANRDTRITAGSLTLNNTAQLKLLLPENGFEANPVLNITGTCSFATTNVQVVIDASACKGSDWQTLLSAGTLSGLTEDNLADRLTISAINPGCQVLTRLSGNQLQVRVSANGTAIIIY